MKKIIKNRVYDTSTAKKIGEFSNGLSYSDFDYLRETLYRKKTGEYFLYGVGGARTWAAYQSGDMWGAGEQIQAISLKEAQEWAEKYLTADEYLAEFEPNSDEEINIRIRVDSETNKKIEEKAEKEGLSKSEVVRRAIRNYV